VTTSTPSVPLAHLRDHIATRSQPIDPTHNIITQEQQQTDTTRHALSSSEAVHPHPYVTTAVSVHARARAGWFLGVGGMLLLTSCCSPAAAASHMCDGSRNAVCPRTAAHAVRAPMRPRHGATPSVCPARLPPSRRHTPRCRSARGGGGCGGVPEAAERYELSVVRELAVESLLCELCFQHRIRRVVLHLTEHPDK